MRIRQERCFSSPLTPSESDPLVHRCQKPLTPALTSGFKQSFFHRRSISGSELPVRDCEIVVHALVSCQLYTYTGVSRASSSSTMLLSAPRRSFTAPAAVRSRSPPQSGSFPQHPGQSDAVFDPNCGVCSLHLTPSDF